MIGALAAAVVLAAFPVHVTTQNVRVTLDRPRAAHDIRQAADVGGIVLTQEMAYRDARTFRPPGWGSAQAPRPRVQNRGDCATFWDRAQWRRVRAWPFHYAFAPFHNGQRWALVTVLRSAATPRVRVAAVCVHMFTHTNARAAAFARATARLRALADRLEARYGRVIMGGDWNRIWSLRASFPGFRSWDPRRTTGPGGGRIDYLFWHGVRATRSRVIDHTFSDHNGFRVRFR